MDNYTQLFLLLILFPIQSLDISYANCLCSWHSGSSTDLEKANETECRSWWISMMLNTFITYHFAVLLANSITLCVCIPLTICNTDCCIVVSQSFLANSFAKFQQLWYQIPRLKAIFPGFVPSCKVHRFMD